MVNNPTVGVEKTSFSHTRNEQTHTRFITALVTCACTSLIGCQSGGSKSLTDNFVPFVALTESYEFEPTGVVENIPKNSALSLSTNESYNLVSEAALKTSEDFSSTKLTVEENKLNLTGLRWEALPSLTPSASVRTTTSDSEDVRNNTYRLGLEQPLFDFGKHASRIDQNNSEIAQSGIRHWIERNDSVGNALNTLLELSLQQELSALSERYVQLHETLYQQINRRFQGGVSDRSELSLVNIRIQELLLQKDSDQRAKDAAADELAFLTELDNSSIQDLPVLTEDFKNVTQRKTDYSPDVAIALSELQMAKAQRQETKGTSLPDIVLEGFTEQNNDDEFQGIEIRFETSTFAGFSYRNQVKQADAAVRTATAQAGLAQREYDREIRRLALEKHNLLGTIESLTEQLQQSEQSVELFFKQFNSGVKPIVDAIRVYESTFNTARQLAEVQTNLQLNQIAIAKLSGTLAPHPEL